MIKEGNSAIEYWGSKDKIEQLIKQIDGLINKANNMKELINLLSMQKIVFEPIIVKKGDRHIIAEVIFSNESFKNIKMPWIKIKKSVNYTIRDFPLLDQYYKKHQGVSITEKYNKQISKEQTFSSKKTTSEESQDKNTLDNKQRLKTSKNVYKLSGRYESPEHKHYGIKKGLHRGY